MARHPSEPESHGGADADTALAQRMREMDALMAVASKVLLPYLVAMAVQGALLLRDVPARYAVPWLVGFAAFIAAREGLTRWYLGSLRERRVALADFWPRAITASALCYGLVWGSGALLGFLHGSAAMKLFWTFLVLAAGANAACVLPMRMLWPQLLLLHGPVALAWARSGEPRALPCAAAIGALTALYLAVGWLGHRREARHRALSLRNEALAGELAARNASLAAANQARTAMLSAASHDLRQPVHAMGMLIELVNPDEPATLRHRLDLLRSSARTLNELLAQLLDFHRLNLGLHKPNLQPVELDLLLGEIGERFDALARIKGLALRIDTPALRVRSDPRLLRRILLNLVSNAVKFTSAGSVRVACRTGAGHVWIDVADTGAGLAAAQVRKFANMPSAADARIELEQGLGLGLSIVRSGVALLGHPLSVAPQPGGGTCFTLDLGPPLPAQARTARGAGADDELLRGTVVAVMEDDALVLEGLRDTLGSWGCRPCGGRSLKEVTDALDGAGLTPDLIVTDLHLSLAISGFDAIGQLRAGFGNPELPALLLTGDLDPQVEDRARAAEILLGHKPLHPNRLRALLLHALQETPPKRPGGRLPPEGDTGGPAQLDPRYPWKDTVAR